MRDGIAHLDLLRGLDARDDVAHIARRQFLFRHLLQLQHANLIGIVFLSRSVELDKVVGADGAIHDAEISDDAAERVEHRVEDESLKWSFGVAFGTRNAFHDGIEHSGHTFTRTGTNLQNFRRVATQEVYHLVFHDVDHGAVHVDFVHHGDDFEVVFEGRIQVGDRLGLDALGGVDHEKGAFAGRDAARHLVGEVDMAGSIDEVEGIFLSLVVIFHLDGVALDGDATLALEVHVVEHLIDEFLVVERMGEFQKPIGQGGFTMVDMGYDAKISDVFHYGRKNRKKNVCGLRKKTREKNRRAMSIEQFLKKV